MRVQYAWVYGNNIEGGIQGDEKYPDGTPNITYDYALEYAKKATGNENIKIKKVKKIGTLLEAAQ
jgi:hypothetical protein